MTKKIGGDNTMCLLTKETHAKVSNKDIICYKTVWIDPLPDIDGATRFHAMFYRFWYRVGKLYTENNFKRHLEQDGFPGHMVRYGFHSYRWEQYAENRCMDSDVNAVLKCRIPAGTCYYESDDETEFCSESIEILDWRFFDQPNKFSEECASTQDK